MAAVVAGSLLLTRLGVAQSTNDAIVRRAAEFLVRAQMAAGSLRIPNDLSAATDSTSCPELIRAVFQIDLAERDVALTHPDLFVRAKLLATEAESARLAAWAEKDSTKRQVALREAVLQLATAALEQRRSRTVSAGDSLARAVARTQIADAGCGGIARHRANAAMEAFRLQAMLRLVTTEPSLLREFSRNPALAELARAETALNASVARLRPSLPGAAPAAQADVENRRAAETASRQKLRTELAKAIRRFAGGR